MGSRKKARKVTTPNHQQHMPSVAPNSTLYTSSYMMVQELSPPLSSPQPSIPSSSSEQAHEFPCATIQNRSCLLGSSTRRRQGNRLATPERPIRQSQELAPQDNSEGAVSPPVRPRAQPRASQPGSSSQKAMIQQTTKLVNVLGRNKALLYDCLTENEDADDENCKTTIMRKISAAVEDWRFQSWRQVKAWMMEHNRRQKRSTKALASCRTLISRERKKKGAVPFGIAFKKNLVPVISASEMNTNRQKFLDSVIEAIGTCRLARAFRHRLVRDDELPADISPLIFSPLFLKTYENWVRKVKSAALNRTGSDDSESEWSDWEEDDEASDESGAIRAVDSNALPSIEQENDSEDVPELVTRERPHEPSMPVTSQEPEIRARPVKMSRKARRKAWRKAWRKRRNAGRNDDQHSDSRNRPPLPSTIEYPALQPVPDQVRVQVQIQIQGQGQGQVAERTRARERESGSLFPPAPNIRPFADFTTPAVSEPPDPEIESIFRLGSLLCNISEPNNIASLNKITRKAINDNKQHVANLGPRGKNKSKKTATENPGKTPSTRNSQDATVSTSQAKEAPTPIPIPIPISNTVLPVRETPAILRAENRRQGRKLAKQLVPTKIPSRPAIRKQKSPRAIWRTQGEIRPPEFYSSSTWETGGTGLSDSHNECKEKENKPVGNNNVVRNIPRRGSPSDDELSLPSLEEIYGHLLPSTKGRSTKISQPGTATAQTQIIPAPGLEPFAQQGKSSKKRPMREHTTSFPVSASSPKRIKLPVDVD